MSCFNLSLLTPCMTRSSAEKGEILSGTTIPALTLSTVRLCAHQSTDKLALHGCAPIAYFKANTGSLGQYPRDYVPQHGAWCATQQKN